MSAPHPILTTVRGVLRGGVEQGHVQDPVHPPDRRNCQGGLQVHRQGKNRRGSHRRPEDDNHTRRLALQGPAGLQVRQYIRLFVFTLFQDEVGFCLWYIEFLAKFLEFFRIC